MNFHRPLIASLLSLSFIAPATANDGSYFASGNQIIPLQETDISVKKEVLSIKRIGGDVRITVDYTFHNPTAEKSLLMGFEADTPYGDAIESPKNGQHPYIKNFSVNFNGNAVPHKVSYLTPALQQDGESKKLYTIDDLNKNQLTPKVDNQNAIGEIYVYHFPATFPSGETRVIHTYDYTISSAVFLETEIDYLLTPALRWANKQIDDFTLIIDLGEFQQYHIAPTFFDNLGSWTTHGRVKIAMENVTNEMSGEASQMLTVWQHHGSITFHTKNFHPKGDLSLFANRFISTDEIFDAKTMKLSLQSMPWIHDELKLKDEFTRKVLENLPYARRGHIFKNAELKAFFEAKPWYMPDPDYKEASLTEEEKTFLKDVRELKIGK